MYDPDTGLKRKDEAEELDKVLSALQDCDLSEWDIDFVNDMTDKLAKWGDRIIITGSQWAQLERMKNQYNVKT